jgi:hypothetical protein
MWLSEHDTLKRQIKRLNRELNTLRRERQHAGAKGCYADRQLAAKDIALQDYARRIQILEIERDRLQLTHQTGGSHDVEAES